MLERLLIDLTNNKNIHQGDNTIKVRDLFSRKQESITKTDDKLFSMYSFVFSKNFPLPFPINTLTGEPLILTG